VRHRWRMPPEGDDVRRAIHRRRFAHRTVASGAISTHQAAVRYANRGGAGGSVLAVGNPLVERMRTFGTTIFAEMSALALETGSINLGQGFPDTDGPPEILAAAQRAIASGHNQYPPGPGIPELRYAVADHQKRFYGLDLDPADVLITAGATEAIAAALLALIDTGEEVITFEPYYDSYAACIALAGGARRVITLHRDGQGWTFDADELRRAVTARTKVILLNTPHNPTGKVFTRDELSTIAAVAQDHDLIVITDEVYEHLVFDGIHVPMATLPDLAARTLTIGSAGKTFSVTGWKIGWITGPRELVSAVRTVKQFLTYVSGAPLQPAVALALALPDRYYDQARSTLQHQRDLFCTGLTERGYDVISPQATYFATVQVEGDATEFCGELPVACGVVAIPSSVFYDTDAGEHFVRFAFCKRPEVIRQALHRLERGPELGLGGLR
jgi:N-succinyldiaminopimelate aminotransferase